MADADEDRPLTMEEKWENWQFFKAILDYRNGHLTEDEAVEWMAKWSGLFPRFCRVFLHEHHTDKYLERARPKGLRLDKVLLVTSPVERALDRRRRRVQARGTSRGSSRRAAET